MAVGYTYNRHFKRWRVQLRNEYGKLIYKRCKSEEEAKRIAEAELERVRLALEADPTTLPEGMKIGRGRPRKP